MPSVADAVYERRAVAEVAALLAAGGSANEDSAQTPLHHAAWNGDVPTIELLLRHDADINARSNFDGNTVLGCAIQEGHLDATTYLLDQGADLHAQCLPGWSTLRTAAHFGWPKIVQLLLSRGAVFSGGEIHAAAYRGRVDVLEILLDSGDINEMYNGSTPLMAAFKGNRLNTSQFLLSKGADVSISNEKGVTVLHVAVANDNVDLVRLALENGANPLATSAGGYTAFAVAASTNVVAAILEVANPEMPLSRALDECIDAKQPACVDLLLERGAKPNLTRENTTSRFFAAVVCGSIKLVKSILDTGRVDANAPNAQSSGCTALMLSGGLSNVLLMELLLSYGAKVGILDDAGRQAVHWTNNVECMRALLDAGADVNAMNAENGLSPLQRAVMRQDLELTKFLVERGANVNRATDSGIRWTALIICAKMTGDVGVLRALLDAGADMESTDADGRTTAWHAAARGKSDMTKTLGIGNTRDRFGATPLIAAARNGHADVVRILLEKGSDVGAVDHFGLTAAGWAEQTGEDELLGMLRQAGDHGKGREGLTNVVYHPDVPACDGCGRSLDDKGGHSVCDTCSYSRFLNCRDCMAVGISCRGEGHSFIPLE